MRWWWGSWFMLWLLLIQINSEWVKCLAFFPLQKTYVIRVAHWLTVCLTTLYTYDHCRFSICWSLKCEIDCSSVWPPSWNLATHCFAVRTVSILMAELSSAKCSEREKKDTANNNWSDVTLCRALLWYSVSNKAHSFWSYVVGVYLLTRMLCKDWIQFLSSLKGAKRCYPLRGQVLAS